VSGIEVAIERFRDFFSCTWLPYLIQRSKEMLVEAFVWISRRGHFAISDLRMNLLREAHLLFGPVASTNRLTKKALVQAEVSTCELPQAHAVRQHPPKYTTVRIRL